MAKLTDDQQEFVDKHLIELCLNNKDVSNAVMYIKQVLAQKGNYINFMDIIDAIATIGSWETSPAQKQASKIMLKFVFNVHLINDIVEEYAVITDRTDPVVTRWRNKVLARDNYRCQHCGSEEHLAAHHISYWSNDPINRINVNNGITLCKSSPIAF